MSTGTKHTRTILAAYSTEKPVNIDICSAKALQTECLCPLEPHRPEHYWRRPVQRNLWILPFALPYKLNACVHWNQTDRTIVAAYSTEKPVNTDICSVIQTECLCPLEPYTQNNIGGAQYRETCGYCHLLCHTNWMLLSTGTIQTRTILTAYNHSTDKLNEPHSAPTAATSTSGLV